MRCRKRCPSCWCQACCARRGSMREQIAALWRFGPVMVADHRRDDSMEAIAHRILSQAPPRFALAGLSMGGYIALTIVREAPERVVKLALARQRGAAGNAGADRAPAAADRAGTQAGAFPKCRPLTWPLFVHRNRQGDEALKRVVQTMAEETGAEAFVRQQRAIMGRQDARPMLPSIRCPTLVLVGDGDELTPPALAAGDRGRHRRRAARRDSRLRTSVDAGAAGCGERGAGRMDGRRDDAIDGHDHGPRSHRRHAARRGDAHRPRTLPAVPQARKRQSVRLDQGPAGARHDRGRGSRRPAQARRHHRRGDRRQYRARPRAGRRAQGLSHASWSCPTRWRARRCCTRKAMGAEVVVTRSDVGKGHPDYYQDLAAAITARTPGAFFINQFDNPANPRAHETTTGPEILRQMEGDVDAVVVGVGSGGTLTGIGRYMRRFAEDRDGAGRSRRLDPRAVCEDRRDDRGRKLGGRGHRRGFHPAQLRSLAGVARPIRSPIADSFALARDLLRQEGILAGSSSGTLLAAALRYCRAQSEPKRVVSLVCDSGAKYLSKVFNDAFLAQEGFPIRDRHGTVRDVVSPIATARAPPSRCGRTTICARCLRACARPMSRSFRWSRRPHRRPGGRERSCSPRCSPTRRGQGTFDQSVKDIMVTRLETISADAPIARSGRRCSGRTTSRSSWTATSSWAWRRGSTSSIISGSRRDARPGCYAGLSCPRKRASVNNDRAMMRRSCTQFGEAGGYWIIRFRG